MKPTNEQIIGLAKQAGFSIHTEDSNYMEMLYSFAALVRAQTLEEAAVVCETNADRWPGTSKVYAAMECAAAIRALKGTPNVLE